MIVSFQLRYLRYLRRLMRHCHTGPVFAIHPNHMNMYRTTLSLALLRMESQVVMMAPDPLCYAFFYLPKGDQSKWFLISGNLILQAGIFHRIRTRLIHLNPAGRAGIAASDWLMETIWSARTGPTTAEKSSSASAWICPPGSRLFVGPVGRWGIDLLGSELPIEEEIQRSRLAYSMAHGGLNSVNIISRRVRGW
jgi:hypothetical protein